MKNGEKIEKLDIEEAWGEIMEKITNGMNKLISKVKVKVKENHEIKPVWMNNKVMKKINKMAKPDRYISNSKGLKLPVFVTFNTFCYKIDKQQPSRCACYTTAFGSL